VKASGASPVAQQLVGSAARAIDMTSLAVLEKSPDFKSVQWDVANGSLDPHVVGVAFKKS
jgi:hypothetical protein